MLSGKINNAKPGPRIRPPRRVMTGGTSEFETLWQMLKSSFCDIHNKNASALAFEQLYRAAYKIVLKKKGSVLWQQVTEFETEWFSAKVMPIIKTLITAKTINAALGEVSEVSATERRNLGEKFLKGLRDTWEEHQTAMNMITDILMYMDRTMVTDARKPSIFTSSIGLYRDNVLLANPTEHGAEYKVCALVNAVIIDMINMERRGDVIDRSLIRSICAMLENLHQTDEEKDDERLYLVVFEPHYIEESRKFYANEAQIMLQKQNCGAWLRHAEQRLKEEEDRCKTTLSTRSSVGITEVVEQELVIRHLDEFLSLDRTGLGAMIDNDKRDDLSILYRLLLRVDSKLPHLKAAISKRVLESGLEIEKAVGNMDLSTVSNQKDGEEAKASSAPKTGSAAAQQATSSALKWVQDVLDLRKRFRMMLQVCFDNNSIIESALAKSFADFVNLFPRASEFISLYIDAYMKKGTRGSENVEPVLEEAIVLINHIQDRDLFERYYQKHLARRLLNSKSESTELEKWFINAMKQQVGTHFTAKFEGMFKDMSVSQDLRTNYKEYIAGLEGKIEPPASSYKKIELAINVLTSNNWPADSMGRNQGDGDNNDVIFPEDIQKLQNSFLKYYSNGRNGRVLTWVPSVGTAEIKCIFPKLKESGPLSKERRYDLTVSTYGMIVIMLFNDIPDDEWLSFEEIKERTNIPANDLHRALVGITIPPKSRILLKEPNTKSIKPGNKFCFNSSFVSKTIKIKAPTVNPSRVESREERKKTEDKNNETRANACSAALVRIMKQRKELTHTLLTGEVMAQLSSRFCPDIPIIKQQIDGLITKEYLERMDIGGVPGYKYLA
ncbi:putative cullulin 3 protein [Zalerion maritima]|uniref:Cullulin 3 protein n=1 Tax=Zalerion maritima TaxID=339359 RepID=A0AAD5RXZ0_9PEZI|nr:putative cullulin 3 protein [Zalerion maritima]